MKAIDAEDLCPAVIALTMHLDPGIAERLFRLGLDGYVIKEAAFDDLRAALYAVAAGDTFVNATVEAARQRSDDIAPDEWRCRPVPRSGRDA